MMVASSLGIIGGSGLYSVTARPDIRIEKLPTPYSSDPVQLHLEQADGRDFWFIPRHGKNHSIPPHRINYRANMWALKEVGVSRLVAVNAVGAIQEGLLAGAIVLPDQLIDYTWGREHSYFDGLDSLQNHVDFTFPYDTDLARIISQSCHALKIPVHQTGVYGCTQGPRLETAAEVRKLKNDGCDIVGMTGMPEAALARELDLRYSCLALVVNRAAGLDANPITMAQIQAALDQGLDDVRRIIFASLPLLLDPAT
ncbi:MAG: S-methyl-5'-thioinosine phosphorylase [Pseudomonadales bacterium]|nr:S-methyl-5'-thioinosine phosphorylase [Pseudomonadales bacterium]